MKKEARGLYKQSKTEEATAKAMEGLEAAPRHRGLLKLKEALQQ